MGMVSPPHVLLCLWFILKVTQVRSEAIKFINTVINQLSWINGCDRFS